MKTHTVYAVVALNPQGGKSWEESPQGYSKFYERWQAWEERGGKIEDYDVFGLDQAREFLQELWVKYPDYHYAIEVQVVTRTAHLLGWYKEVDPSSRVPTGSLVRFTEWKEAEIIPYLSGVFKVKIDTDDCYVQRLPQYDQAALDRQILGR
jgi:hypothetical protein